jgi:hypothetical protein
MLGSNSLQLWVLDVANTTQDMAQYCCLNSRAHSLFLLLLLLITAASTAASPMQGSDGPSHAETVGDAGEDRDDNHTDAAAASAAGAAADGLAAAAEQLG